jgi:SAM-dependent methyltransferase
LKLPTPTAPPSEHEHSTATCAWCGSELDPGGARTRGRVVCARCGAATTYPWPSDAELAAAYGNWYRPRAGGRYHFGFDALLARTRARLANRLDRIAPPGRILDVGAGEGTLVDALRAKGRQATGTEREPLRDDLLDQPLSKLEAGWAAVVFWHSLEHLTAPRAAVREAARLLDSGGVAVIAVPNNDSIQAKLFGDRWLHLDLPRHLVHLPARTLLAGVEEDGFGIERVSYLRGGQHVIGWLDGLVGSLPGRPRLYESLRRPAARSTAVPPAARAATIAAGAALAPVALVGAGTEIALRRGGTVYVEARLG